MLAAAGSYFGDLPPGWAVAAELQLRTAAWLLLSVRTLWLQSLIQNLRLTETGGSKKLVHVGLIFP